MHSYMAYGLGIHSALPLTGFAPGSNGADVQVRLARLDETRAELSARGTEFEMLPGEARFWWDDIGAFVVREGREILVDPAPGAHEDDLRVGILGPALAALLQQRGFLLLHASAVVIGGSAVAFLGRSGRGKSTMAAALHAAGHPLLADDLLAIRFVDGRPQAYPGLLQFKLWPDAIMALGGDPAHVPQLYPGYEKRLLRPAEHMSREISEPVGHLFVLAHGDEPSIAELPQRDAFLQLANHSLGIRWFLNGTNSSHFATRARLAREVSVRLLRRPRNLELLPEVARLVERDVSHAG